MPSLSLNGMEIIDIINIECLAHNYHSTNATFFHIRTTIIEFIIMLHTLLLLRVVQERVPYGNYSSTYFTILAEDIVQYVIQSLLYKILQEKCL